MEAVDKEELKVAQKPDYFSNTKTENKDNESSSKVYTIYNIGDIIDVGYMSYTIHSAEWIDQIDGERPDAAFLRINLSITNKDKKERNVASFKLIDENENEYNSSSAGGFVSGKIDSFFKPLNPNVSTKGFILFDVPRKNTYVLTLSGGIWSTDKVFVLLDLDKQEVKKVIKKRK